MTFRTACSVAALLSIACGSVASAQVRAKGEALIVNQGPPGNKGPTGDKGPPGDKGPVGDKVTLGYRVVPTPFTAAASSNNVYRSLCGANEKVVGGGYAWTSKGDGVMASRPMPQGQGWELVLFNFNPNAMTGQVHAICMSGF